MVGPMAALGRRPTTRGIAVNNRVCEMLGIEFPILAFTHCRDVVAAVTKAGGMGVLGAAALTPEELDIDLGGSPSRSATSRSAST